MRQGGKAVGKINDGETSVYDDLNLGGERGSLVGYALNPFDPNREMTQKVINNELTWMFRHAMASATPRYVEGQLVIDYYIYDDLNLDSHKGQPGYNMIAVPLGNIWGGLLGHSFPRTSASFTIKY